MRFNTLFNNTVKHAAHFYEHTIMCVCARMRAVSLVMSVAACNTICVLSARPPPVRIPNTEPGGAMGVAFYANRTGSRPPCAHVRKMCNRELAVRWCGCGAAEKCVYTMRDTFAALCRPAGRGVGRRAKIIYIRQSSALAAAATIVDRIRVVRLISSTPLLATQPRHTHTYQSCVSILALIAEQR